MRRPFGRLIFFEGTVLIGERLIRSGYLEESGLKEALHFQESFGGLIGQACLKLGLLREDDLLSTLSDQLKLPIINPNSIPERDRLLAGAKQLGLSTNFLIEQDALVWVDSVANDDPSSATVHVLARHPIQPSLQEAIVKQTAHNTQFYIGPNRLIDNALGTLKAERSNDADEDGSLVKLRQLAEEAPVIDFVNGLFADAMEFDASDIHIEPEEYGFGTRYRVDGVLGLERQHPKQMFDAVSTRIKILSNMDIAERRLPQDGRQGIRIGGQPVDLRVSSLPGAFGESIVIRLLKKKAALPDLSGLGLKGRLLEQFRRIASEPNGIILVTGPTGSGKSTTLYRMIEEINDGSRKIITIEDPIEYEVSGVTQVNARADIGLSFAAGMRSMLRQDPDVILVGEVRDGETAIIATTAALTGHLVLSTLHTNSALGAVDRLLDLGVEPFLLEASLRGVIGQRLIRRLCADCAHPVDENTIDPQLRARALAALNDFEPSAKEQWRASTGCEVCNHTGYRGRVGVFEILEMKRDGPTMMSSTLSRDEKLTRARENGFKTMADHALLQAVLGQTSLSELTRVFGKV